VRSHLLVPLLLEELQRRRDNDDQARRLKDRRVRMDAVRERRK
jgi:hypothetical protein